VPFGQDDDVWYRFTATSGHLRITVDGDGNTTTGYDAVMELINGTPCNGTFNDIFCADETGPGGTEQIEFDGLVAGNSYFVLVYSAGYAPVDHTRTFRICVEDLNISTGIEATSTEGWSCMLDAGARTLTLRHAATGDDRGTWVLLDAMGRAISTGNIELAAGGSTRIPLNGLATGAYALGLSTATGRTVHRFVLP
jgi:hypothetical protein